MMTQRFRKRQNPNGGFHKDFQLKNSLKFSVKNLLRSESGIRAALGFFCQRRRGADGIAPSPSQQQQKECARAGVEVAAP
jgi:hypothetical protein